eukprot:CAMPEP_0117698932 /NCGR_PEP_ID=MMETSP0804-20121206/30011_1 /TAXON_ID=1074897 /ORGANISM="Tetraselmis astigmatica, Strain CCMP880" /LENGTH=67 /DNA_ID=CAMNT_0005513253 /DNA_START=283 /DNA_END=486 /DNA_ORIENTATION=-
MARHFSLLDEVEGEISAHGSSLPAWTHGAQQAAQPSPALRGYRQPRQAGAVCAVLDLVSPAGVLQPG